jgi:4-aminobutyrate aminotransferase
MENTRVVGAYCKAALEELQAKHPSIGDVRGKGFMLGVEFVEDRGSKHPAESLRDAVVNKAFERGLLLLGCGKSVIRVTPPLSTSKSEVDEAILILDEAISLAEKDHAIA